jgi:hypothetical protein
MTPQTKQQALVEIEKLTTRLNDNPKPEWLQKTPDGKAVYIPIGIIENQLRKDFAGLVQYEILSERRELNEYVVTARIKVFNLVINQWINYDGIGSVQIMQDSGSTLANFNETKKKNALQMNAPKAYAEAIKNAAKKIGIKYGANLNRKFEEAYEPEYTTIEILSEINNQIGLCKNLDELKILWDNYPEMHSNNRFKVEFGIAKKRMEVKK